MLQIGDFLFDRAATDESIREDLLCLPDAVCPVDSLRLDGRIPPGVEQENILGSSQVKAEAARLQTDQEVWTFRVIMEPVNVLFAVSSLTIEIFVSDAFLVESLSDDCQQTGELREDQCLVALADQFLNMREQNVHLR